MPSHKNENLPFKLLRLKEVLQIVGVSRSTWYGFLREGGPSFDPDCPKPVKIGQKCVAWVLSEVEAYVEKKIQRSRNAELG